MRTMMTTATVTEAVSAGMLTCRLAGKRSTDKIRCASAVASAQPGWQVLVTAISGQMWATSIIGTKTMTTIDEPWAQPVAPETNTLLTGAAGITAAAARTAIAGAWTSGSEEMACGDYDASGIKSGAAFFGPALAGYGTITGLTLTLNRLPGGDAAAAAPTMRLLAGDGSIPAAYPPVLDTADGPALTPGETAGWAIPDSWLARLGLGGDAGGIGTGNDTATPYLRLAKPRAAIEWKRRITA